MLILTLITEEIKIAYLNRSGSRFQGLPSVTSDYRLRYCDKLHPLAILTDECHIFSVTSDYRLRYCDSGRWPAASNTSLLTTL